MLAKNKRNTNIGVGIGVPLEVAGSLMMEKPSLELWASILFLAGVVFFIWGCINYAVGKGHSKVMGLLGILSCIGLVILVLLPDKNKEAK